MHELQAMPVTMSSLELLDIINTARADLGETELRRNWFHEKIEDELEGEYYRKSVVQNLNNTSSVVFELTRDQCMLVSMRESKGVRRSVLAKLKAMEAQPVLSAPKPVDMAAALGLVQLTFDHLPNLSEISKQAVLSGMLELVTGKALLPLPKLEEKHYTATEAGAVLGISAAKVGSLANAEGLKIPRFGYYRVQKRKGSDGQCEQWMYNEAGVEALRALLQ